MTALGHYHGAGDGVIDLKKYITNESALSYCPCLREHFHPVVERLHISKRDGT